MAKRRSRPYGTGYAPPCNISGPKRKPRSKPGMGAVFSHRPSEFDSRNALTLFVFQLRSVLPLLGGRATVSGGQFVLRGNCPLHFWNVRGLRPVFPPFFGYSCKFPH